MLNSRYARRRVAMVVLSLMVTIGIALVGATPANASTTVSGYVECVSQNSVVGVWVDAASGTDGWASTTSTGLNYYKKWSYALTSGTSYSLHVGCGGTTQNWEYAINCPWASGNHSFNIYDPDTGYDFCQQV